MMVLIPTSIVLLDELTKHSATLKKFQSNIIKVIPTDEDSSVYYRLSDLKCFKFSQTRDKEAEVQVIYNARGTLTNMRLDFPIAILRHLFTVNYMAELTAIFEGRSLENIFITIVNLDGKYHMKFILQERYSGGSRIIPENFKLVCAKTSLYMDKAFAKNMNFPNSNLTTSQSFLVAHLFDCLYVDDILALPSKGQILHYWATNSWINEFVNLAESTGLDVRDTVDYIRETKRLKKLGKLTHVQPYTEKHNAIHPVDAFSLDFDKQFQ